MRGTRRRQHDSGAALCPPPATEHSDPGGPSVGSAASTENPRTWRALRALSWESPPMGAVWAQFTSVPCLLSIHRARAQPARCPVPTRHSHTALSRGQLPPGPRLPGPRWPSPPRCRGRWLFEVHHSHPVRWSAKRLSLSSSIHLDCPWGEPRVSRAVPSDTGLSCAPLLPAPTMHNVPLPLPPATATPGLLRVQLTSPC